MRVESSGITRPRLVCWACREFGLESSSLLHGMLIVGAAQGRIEAQGYGDRHVEGGV